MVRAMERQAARAERSRAERAKAEAKLARLNGAKRAYDAYHRELDQWTYGHRIEFSPYGGEPQSLEAAFRNIKLKTAPLAHASLRMADDGRGVAVIEALGPHQLPPIETVRLLKS